MPREPARLTRSFLAAHRSGALVAVELDAAAGIPQHRPRGYQLRAANGYAAVAASGPAPSQPGVALIEIRGVITQREEWSSCGEAANYDEIRARYCSAHGDPGVGALLVDCDSPGGDLPGVEEMIECCYLAKVASGKPVVGYVGARAFSAACWLMARLCDVIFVHDSARMGSVGVLIGHETDARKAALEGVDRTIVRDPPGKANPNPDEILDELGRARLQELVSEARGRFVAQLAAFRGLDPAVILSWNGGTFTGPAAVAAGLANGPGTLDTAIAHAASLAAFGAQA